MKKLRFNRQTIDCQPFVSEVITEDDIYYYFYNERGFYDRIKKLHEGKKYTITSTFTGGRQ